MELRDLIREARINKCSDLHITAGAEVGVRRYGELQLLDIKPTAEETEKMLFSVLRADDISDTEPVGSADDCTQIAGVLHAVQCQQQIVWWVRQGVLRLFKHTDNALWMAELRHLFDGCFARF